MVDVDWTNTVPLTPKLGVEYSSFQILAKRLERGKFKNLLTGCRLMHGTVFNVPLHRQLEIGQIMWDR